MSVLEIGVLEMNVFALEMLNVIKDGVDVQQKRI
jgi:hypothetical protein